jgi:maltose alpha-D-glucosyltransferase/alpha-amylase
MRYLNLVSKEGGYNRTGARTPMQWNKGKNLGFSTAEAEKLYLPVDPAADAPTVEDAEKDPGSLLNTIRTLLSLRHAEPDLRSTPNLEIVFAEKSRLPFVYKRGSLLLAVNPGTEPATAGILLAGKPSPVDAKPLYAIGDCIFDKDSLCMKGMSFGIWRLKTV